MRPTSNGQTARDVRASTRQWRQAVSAKLSIPQDVIDRKTADCVADTFRFLAKLGVASPAATDGACSVCGVLPTHGTVMVGEMCSKCWRHG